MCVAYKTAFSSFTPSTKIVLDIFMIYDRQSMHSSHCFIENVQAWQTLQVFKIFSISGGMNTSLVLVTCYNT